MTGNIGHRRVDDLPVSGDAAIALLVDMGVCPADTTRVVIDVTAGHVPIVYVEQHATMGLLEVLRAISRATVITRERPASTPANENHE
jgi:hypothetical protein